MAPSVVVVTPSRKPHVGDQAPRVHLGSRRCGRVAWPLARSAAAGEKPQGRTDPSGGVYEGYFRAKVAQEKLIKTSGIPYTIIRSTRFLEFLGGIAASSADGIVRISPALFQPSRRT